jgi:hypothetical protein
MNRWIRGAASAGLITAISLGASARTSAKEADRGEKREMLHMTVTVYDYAGVPADVLSKAKAIAGDVYRQAGIDVEWVEPSGGPVAPGFYVNLIPSVEASLTLTREAVGFAAPESLEATVIYDRIRAIGRDRRISKGLLLGYVMAHEIGHLLLPAHSHSNSGLMRPNLDLQLAAAKRLLFTTDQAQVMLGKLSAAADRTPGVVVSTN